MELTKVINWFVERNLYQKFLEINLTDKRRFNNITCKIKDCVGKGIDPPATCRNHFNFETYYFYRYNVANYDIVLLNGSDCLVLNCDINGALNSLEKNGVLIVNAQPVPGEEREGFLGDPWEAVVYQRANNRNINVRTIVDGEVSYCIIQNVYNSSLYNGPTGTHEDMTKNFKEIFNPIEEDELMRYY